MVVEVEVAAVELPVAEAEDRLSVVAELEAVLAEEPEAVE